MIDTWRVTQEAGSGVVMMVATHGSMVTSIWRSDRGRRLSIMMIKSTEKLNFGDRTDHTSPSNLLILQNDINIFLRIPLPS